MLLGLYHYSPTKFRDHPHIPDAKMGRHQGSLGHITEVRGVIEYRLRLNLPGPESSVKGFVLLQCRISTKVQKTHADRQSLVLQ